MARRRNRQHNGLDAWPGYVDALSTLLMVVTFVLLVFVIGQQFLSIAFNKRGHMLDSLKQQLSELSHILSMTQDKNRALSASVASLTAERARVKAELSAIETQLATLNGEARAKDQALSESISAAKAQDDQIAALSAQIVELTRQLQAISSALELEKDAEKAKDVQIETLGKRLNLALADKVNQLKRYRSEFFGRLRVLLKNQPGVEIVGDRFVFQSEILFPEGSAALSAEGYRQIRTLARTLRQVGATIPADIPWILRVDGHADRQPIHTSFPSNWELSSARAIAVVKVLIKEGIDPRHLAATGFASYQPLDRASTPQAYARNRRIEFRLTDR